MLAVMHKYLWPRDRRLALADVRWYFVPERLKDRFDVLARAEGVGLEIGAGATVVAGIEATDGDLIRASRRGIGDVEVAKNSLIAGVLDTEPASTSPLTANVDLFDSQLFAEHSNPLRRSPRHYPVPKTLS